MLSRLIEPFIQLLHDFSTVLPLPWFTFIGAFVEEVIAPIPSPLVMTLSGSLAGSQEQAVTFLGVLALIGAVGKTIGSYLIYILADKGEDFVTKKFGKFLGISGQEVEQFGKYLNHGVRDDIVLFLMRAIPIMPTAPVSIVCGLIKVNLRTYLVSTFLGTIVRNALYLYLGYTSIGALESINEGLDSFESVGYVILFVLLAGIVGFMYLQRRKNSVDIFARFSKPTGKQSSSKNAKRAKA